MIQELKLIYLRWKWERAFKKANVPAYKMVFPPFIYTDKDGYPTCWKGQHVSWFKRKFVL